MSIVDDFVEIRLKESEDFLKIKETLTRIGVCSKREKKLFQSCHILHKQGKYYIPHFKQLFELDGKESNFSEEDRARRNTIIALLQDWGLLIVVDPSKLEPRAHISAVKIIAHREKKDWTLVSKYAIGRKR